MPGMPLPWIPRRVLVTPSALAWPDGARIAERAAALGSEVVRLGSDRLAGLPDAYRDAKTTMAVVTASASRRRLQPIPPSADWRFDLAEGCPAHCSYCYLAGSLAGPPIVRAYANLPEILAELPAAVGQGQVTSASAERAGEGTTFECSCYTDPLAIEHLTGSLAACITHFGAWDAPVQLRFTTKFDAVAPLLGLPHNGRTRIRFSVNAAAAERHEGGAPRMTARLAALRAVAQAGYPGRADGGADPARAGLGRGLRPAVRRRRGGAGRRAGRGPDRRADHPPLHAEIEGRAGRLVSRAARSRWTRRSGPARRPSSAR